MSSRAEVYEVIDGERNYQDQKWPKEKVSDRPVATEPTVGKSVVLLQQYVTQAIEQWALQEGDTAALHQIRKVAAIAVRCMEYHGAPRREGF